MKLLLGGSLLWSSDPLLLSGIPGATARCDPHMSPERGHRGCCDVPGKRHRSQDLASDLACFALAVSWKTVGREQWGLGQAQGTISAAHRLNFPDVQGPEVLLAARLAMLQPPEEGEKRSANQSPGKKGLPYQMNNLGAGWGRGWRMIGVWQCSAPLEATPPLVSWYGEFCVLNPTQSLQPRRFWYAWDPH